MILGPDRNHLTARIFFEIGLGTYFEDVDIKGGADGTEFKTLELASRNTLAYEVNQQGCDQWPVNNEAGVEFVMPTSK